jgi:hypothetical protein
MVMLLIFMSGWLQDEGEQEQPAPTSSVPASPTTINDETMRAILSQLAELRDLKQASQV